MLRQKGAEVVFILGQGKTLKQMPQVPVWFEPVSLGILDQGVDGSAGSGSFHIT